VGRGLLLDSYLVEGSGAEETTIAFRPCSDRNLALTLSTPSCNVIRVPHGDLVTGDLYTTHSTKELVFSDSTRYTKFGLRALTS